MLCALQTVHIAFGSQTFAIRDSERTWCMSKRLLYIILMMKTQREDLNIKPQLKDAYTLE